MIRFVCLDGPLDGQRVEADVDVPPPPGYLRVVGNGAPYAWYAWLGTDAPPEGGTP